MRMKAISILRFEKGFNVAIGRSISNNFFAIAYGTAVKGGRYNKAECKEGFGYGTPESLNFKVQNSGQENRHYWKTIKQMIRDIEQISGLKLIGKEYFG